MDSTVFAEESHVETITKYGESPANYVKNSTVWTPEGIEIGGYYLRSGNNGTHHFISYFDVDTVNIPQTDSEHKILIESVELEMLAKFAENSSQKYSTTVSLCVDQFEKEIQTISFNKNDDQFFTHNYYATQICKVISPQDTIVIDGKDLPRIYKWDVSGVSSFLIEKKVSKMLFVITTFPIVEEKQIDYYKLPETSTGLVSFISFRDVYGITSTPTLKINYSFKPTEFQIIFNSLVTIWPFIAVILSPIVGYPITQRFAKNGAVKKAVTTILTEIKENEKTLKGENDDPIIERKTTDGVQIRYVHCFLDVDAYESVLVSEQFGHLKADTQDVLRKIYTRMKDHNDDIKIRNNIEDQYQIQNDKLDEEKVNRITEKYTKHLTTIESEISVLLPKIKEHLDNEVKRHSWSTFFPFYFHHFLSEFKIVCRILKKSVENADR